MDIANSNTNTIAPAIFITMKAIKVHGKNAKSVVIFLKKSNTIQNWLLNLNKLMALRLIWSESRYYRNDGRCATHYRRQVTAITESVDDFYTDL